MVGTTTGFASPTRLNYAVNLLPASTSGIAGTISSCRGAATQKQVKRVLLQLGAGAKKAPFLLCDQRYVPVLSGRLEYPANNHCIRIRVTIGKHRALPLPQ